MVVRPEDDGAGGVEEGEQEAKNKNEISEGGGGKRIAAGAGRQGKRAKREDVSEKRAKAQGGLDRWLK